MKSKSTKPQRSPADDQARWQLYEMLKSSYTARVESSAEYDAAIRRAKIEVGV